MVEQSSTLQERADPKVALLAGAVSTAVAAVVVEALTDRDWAVRGIEWVEVIAAALVLTVGALWVVWRLAPRETPESSSSLRQLTKAGLERLGYRITRVPPLASEPAYALEVDFDYVVADYARRRNDPRPFFFVQVGAFDGVTHDRLHVHVRERGWHGVLVEPQPQYFAKLVENYDDLEGLTLVNAAIDKAGGLRPLYGFQSERGEPIDELAPLSTLSKERLVDWQRQDGQQAAMGCQIGFTQVACLTFDDLLRDVEYIDLLHMDVEGHDLELLKLFDFNRLAPPIVRFEHVHLSRADWDEAVTLLTGHGYRMLREEHDTTGYSRRSSPASRARNY